MNDDESAFKTIRYYIWRKYHIFADISVSYTKARWLFAFIIFVYYLKRVLMYNGLHLITYFVALQILESFIGFISPKDAEQMEAGSMPTYEGDEFRPFKRAIREYDFWLQFATTLLGGTLLSFIELLRMPIYWPLLLMYFIIVFIALFKQRITHMIQYGYLPFDISKKNYNTVPKRR